MQGGIDFFCRKPCDDERERVCEREREKVRASEREGE
jgi:hypothetical protein